MAQIVLTDDQARALQAATEAVEIRDQHGKLLGYVWPAPSDAEIAQARQRLQSDGPWHTTQQVLDRLNSLEQG